MVGDGLIVGFSFVAVPCRNWQKSAGGVPTVSNTTAARLLLNVILYACELAEFLADP